MPIVHRNLPTIVIVLRPPALSRVLDLPPPDVPGPNPERVIRRRCLADDADVRAGPLRRPRVYLTLGAVGPLDADGDRDGVAVVADVEAVEFAGPLVGRVLDRLT